VVQQSGNASEPWRILFIASEADPLVKVGGLGDVAGSLPNSLRAIPEEELGGHRLDVRLAIPYHGTVDLQGHSPQIVDRFPIRTRKGLVKARVFKIHLDGLPVYLIAGDPIPASASVYSLTTSDDGPKFAFFSQAAMELALRMDGAVQILHANDWHTAAAVYALALRRRDDPSLSQLHSVLTVHNLPFMGVGTEDALQDYELPPTDDPRLPDWAKGAPLPLGLLSADRIVAVSPGYAGEILTPEFGCGLEDFLKTRVDVITGILNGIDTVVWDPEKDPHLPVHYNSQDISGRSQDRVALLSEFSLDPDPRLPLLVIVSRMDRQKGIDIALKGLRLASSLPWQAIILGSGDPKLESEAHRLVTDFPERVRAVMHYDGQLSHRLYAGGDVLLMPSRYEPCGLAQMIAMRYGCLPLAHATGGLHDTILDDTQLYNNTGFLYSSNTPQNFAAALQRVLTIFQDAQLWHRLQSNAMSQDFSWRRSALEYARLYQSLLEDKP
jgi:starch synthase